MWGYVGIIMSGPVHTTHSLKSHFALFAHTRPDFLFFLEKIFSGKLCNFWLANKVGFAEKKPKNKSIPPHINTFFISGAKGLGVLHHLPIFRPFFHFHENPSSSVISVAFSRENCFPPKPEKRPKIAKHTKHEPLPKRDAIFATFP